MRGFLPPGRGGPGAHLSSGKARGPGSLPRREVNCETLAVPPLRAFETFPKGSGERELSTTMAVCACRHAPEGSRPWALCGAHRS